MQYTDRVAQEGMVITPEDNLPLFHKSGVIVFSNQDTFACEVFAAYIQAIEEDPEYEHLAPLYWKKYNDLYGEPE